MKIKNIADGIAFTINAFSVVLFGGENKEKPRKRTVIKPRTRITANRALRSDWEKLSIDANNAVNKVKNKYGI